MSGVPPPNRCAPRALRRVGLGFVGTVFLALVAVVAMHGVDPTVAVRAAGHIGSAELAIGHPHGGTMDSDSPLKDVPGEPCHGDGHCRHVQICESGAVSSPIELPAPTSAFEGLDASRPLSLFDTVAADAARGTGCGPPSLWDLSISRT